jgi:NAD(P)-dependent dehydrogenase (short-subunit alcohol dehydrogenase family)
MKNRIDLSDQVVMISGVSGQLGQFLVNEVLISGAKVLGIDQSFEKMNEIAKFYSWSKESVLLQEADIRIKNEIEKAFNNGLNHFGKITAQINNAGVSVFEAWSDRKEEDFDWVTDVNLKGTFFCMQIFMNQSIKSKQVGSIINIASHYGLISPDPKIYTDCARRNSEVYGASKAGVIQMTKYFAVNALNDGAKIRVNAIAPGGIVNPWDPQGEDFQKLYSQRCPMGRLAELSEIVGPVLFLLSEDASYINGHTLVVDGGMTAW